MKSFRASGTLLFAAAVLLWLSACEERSPIGPQGGDEAPESDPAGEYSPSSPGPVTALPELVAVGAVEGLSLEDQGSGQGPELEGLESGALSSLQGAVSAEASATVDGKNDLVWRNQATGAIATWLMDGFTVADDPGVGKVDPVWSIVGVGDFEGSATPDDLLWRNGSTGQIAVWLMDGITLTDDPKIGKVSTSWSIVGVGDFEGSGSRDDILWRRGSTGQIAVWLMDGLSLTSDPKVGKVDPVWSIVGVGDYEESGTSDDILWRHGSTGDVAVWLMDGTTVTDDPGVGSVNTVWEIVGTGDYEASGFDNDIVWRNPSNGRNVVWTMDGTSMASDTDLTRVGNSDWTIRGTGTIGLSQPDLIVSLLTHSPSSPTSADLITFTAVVENVGSSSAELSELVFIVGGESSGKLFTVPSLAPGETHTVQRQEQLPAEDYVNTVTADVNDAVTESDETNNEAMDSYTVSPPSTDLVAVELDILPSGVLETESVSLDLVIDEETGSDPTEYGWRVVEGSTVLASGTTTASGGRDTITVSGLGPFSQGIHRLGLELDYENEVPESDEENNGWDAPLVSRPAGYDIEIQYVGDVSQKVRDLIPGQVSRWESVIVGDVPDFMPSTEGLDVDLCAKEDADLDPRTTPIDDILILIQEDSIDGDGGTLARAGPCYGRSAPASDLHTITLVGRVTMDTADLDFSDSLIEDVLAHEMGHTFGLILDVYYDAGGDIVVQPDGSEIYRGESGTSRYHVVGGDEPTPPMASSAHWEEAEFGDEMMTPALNVNSTAILSEVSVGGLADLTYAVDYSAAEAYSIPSSGVSVLQDSEAIPIGDDVARSLPFFVVDMATGDIILIRSPRSESLRLP